MICPACESTDTFFDHGEHACNDCGHRFALGQSQLCPCAQEPVLPSSRYGAICTAAKRDASRRRSSRTMAALSPKERRERAR